MEPFIGQIIMFGGNFAPRGWALCDGQLLPINANSALFSILGTTYGGDGVSTFGLPELRGRTAMHAGTGPGMSPRSLGEKAGHETQTLTVQQMPTHRHTIAAVNSAGGSPSPEGTYIAENGNDNFSDDTPDVTMNSEAVGAAGGGQPVSIVQPFLAVNYIIALQGTYPSRN